MKKNTITRSLLAVSLSLTLATTASLPALAAYVPEDCQTAYSSNAAPSVFSTATETVMTFAERAARFVNITRISAGLSIEGSTAYCNGAYTTFTDYKGTLTITLQSSTNQRDFNDVDEWSETFDGEGAHGILKTPRVTKGMYYRVIATVKINGETVSTISPVQQS